MNDQNNVPILQRIHVMRIPSWIVEDIIREYLQGLNEISPELVALAAVCDTTSKTFAEWIQISHEIQVLFPHGRGIRKRVK